MLAETQKNRVSIMFGEVSNILKLVARMVKVVIYGLNTIVYLLSEMEEDNIFLIFRL